MTNLTAWPTVPFRVLIPLLILLALGPGPALFADDELPQLCRLILHEEINDRGDFELELEIARTEALASQDLFDLVDQLRKEKATELLTYLGAKRDRDFWTVDVKRAELVLERQDLLLEESRLLCQASASGEATEERRGAIARAHRRYVTLDCERLAHRIEMANVELEYAERVREAYIELRQYAAAAATDEMRWNYNVEIAQKKLTHAKQRTASCRAALGGSAKKGE